MSCLTNLKNKFFNDKTLKAFILFLIIAQPFLDVLSYFLIEIEKTAFTTLLRLLMFAAIMLYAFFIAEKKKPYYVFVAVVGSYFLLHVANCFRIGYISLVEDIANFLRTVQMPALTIAFVTIFKRVDKPWIIISKAFFINVFAVWFIIGLSFVVGRPVYTYGGLKLGLMGWFGVHNAQSAIVMLLMPLALFFAYRINSILFAVASIACFTLLFFTGTKLTFYSIFLIAFAFLLLVFINFFTVKQQKGYIKKNAVPVVFLVFAIALSVIFIDISPMQQRLDRQYNAYSNHQTSVDDNMSVLSSNLYVSSLESGDVSSEDSVDTSSDYDSKQENDDNKMTIEEYEVIYRDLAGGFLDDIIDVYGIERVAEKYNYTTQSYILLNNREKKNVFAELAWEDSDIIIKCLGYEYKTLITEKEIYDLENDFPSVFYYSGYLGFALYIGFLLYFIYLIVRELFKDFKNLFTVESGMLCVTFFLLMGASQFSGNVLRRPNVSIYLSLVLATMYIMYNSKQKGEKNVVES